MRPPRDVKRTFLTLLGVLCASAGHVGAAFAQADGTFSGALAATMPEQPYVVAVGVQVDQITHVDQKSENFGVVANLRVEWNDPALAFDPGDPRRDIRIYSREAFKNLVDENGLFAPGFVIHNQQGRRFSQEATVVVSRNGHAVYFERFTATLQAPHFDFVQFPFDSQKFFVHVDAVHPAGFVKFVPLEGGSGLGDMLGEEEWIFEEVRTEVSEVNGIMGRPAARFSLGFQAVRHVNYYLLRIFIPLAVIVLVSWLTFFLQDFGKRVDIAGANLLIFVAFNFTVSNDLPRLGYLTFTDAIMMAFFVFTGMVIAINILFRRMEIRGQEERARRIDLYTIWIYPLTLAVLVLFCWIFMVRRGIHF